MQKEKTNVGKKTWQIHQKKKKHLKAADTATRVQKQKSANKPVEQ